MPKFLIDASSGKYIAVYMDEQILHGCLRLDNIRKRNGNELSEITLTFSADEIKFKHVDGKVIDFLNGYSEETEND